MIYSLIHEHTPDEVNIYILDFASETLRAFEKAPHVGEVILSNDDEKVNNLFKMIKKEIEYRKRLFADYGGNVRSYVKGTSNKVPSIVIVINNFAAFIEIFEEKEETVSFLSREGMKYGIYFVLSALGTSTVRFKLLQNFKQLFVLQLNDETDYSMIVGKTDGLFPSKYEGRGLFKDDKVYEFQVAHIVPNNSFTFIREECRKIRDTWKGNGAKKIRILPKKVDIEFLSKYIENKEKLQIPIGVESGTLAIYYHDLTESYLNMILSESDGSKSFTSDMGMLLHEVYNLEIDVYDLLQEISSKKDSFNKYYSTVKECEEGIDKLFGLVSYRNNTYKDALQSGTKPQEFDTKVIVINSIRELLNNVSKEHKEKLELILEKGEVYYNVHIIWCEKIKNISSMAFTKWYKKHISEGNGLWIGRSINEQYYLKAKQYSANPREDISDDFGFMVKNGKAIKVKVLNTSGEEDE